MLIGILIGLILFAVLGLIFIKDKLVKGIFLGVILVLIASGFYFFNYFLSSFAPPKVTITTSFISTSKNFVNGVTIEKIKVDSFGKKNYPVKYTVIYTTSCKIQHPVGKPPDPPSKIEFNKPGRYTWDEDTTQIRYLHNGLSRQPLDDRNELWWLSRFGNHSICPIAFEREQWYFFRIGDPQIIGIFFYIDANGEEKQFILQSGVSPI